MAVEKEKKEYRRDRNQQIVRKSIESVQPAFNMSTEFLSVYALHSYFRSTRVQASYFGQAGNFNFVFVHYFNGHIS